jgi:hypothetical protein
VTPTPEHLSQRCSAIIEGTNRAADWIAEVRLDSTSLDRDADGLIERLRRARNAARRLGAAAERPVTVGFFGISQAGKSHLISALASGANGTLETDLDGARLNFISHINPPGRGKEATGIVTRFTRQPKPVPKGFPVALMLLSEAEVIKILGNTYLMDFDSEKTSFHATHDLLHAEIDGLRGKVQAAETGGLSADDVVDVMDYFVKRFPRSMGVFQADFWPTATRIAPFLEAADRAKLFALLWGQVPELTDVYLRLRDALAQVGNASVVFAELAALVRPDGAGGYTQRDNIMNVDILERLGRDSADKVNVVPALSGEYHNSVGLPRSVLAALSREMGFALAEPPRAELLESVDLLDFPGYRARLKVSALSDVGKQLENCDPVAELLLRGKVAYLFERYTEDYDMNVLVMCTGSQDQTNTSDMGPALTEWIETTQGATPEERARRKPGLVWAITKFDQRLTKDKDETEDLIRTAWPGLMKQTILEKFKSFEWLSYWTPKAPFSNVYLVRKPGMGEGIFRSEANREVGIEPQHVDRLALMRRTFLEEPLVRTFVADPGAAWDAMLEIDDGGMGRILAYIEQVTRRTEKLTRIGELVDALAHDLVEAQFGKYYRSEGADEVERKKAAADKVIKALMPRPHLLGELVALMQPSSEHVRALYLRAETEAEAEGPDGPTDVMLIGGGFISLDLGMPVTGVEPAVGGSARLAKRLISDWQKQLRGLPDSQDVHRFFALSAEILQIIVDEVITGADRQRIESRLADRLRVAEDRAGTKRERLVDQQALVACAAIAEYVDTFGFREKPEDKRPESRWVKGRRLFAAPPRFEGLPQVGDEPLNFTAYQIYDWLDAFAHTAIGNAGHTAGSEISPEQNMRLGAIVKTIAGAEA